MRDQKRWFEDLDGESEGGLRWTNEEKIKANQVCMNKESQISNFGLEQVGNG